MEIIRVDEKNLDKEHLCCAMADKRCTQSKRDWVRARLEEGYVFYKLDVPGKVFLEYTPAENAWIPLDAPGYLFLDCLWVAGKYHGQGWGKKLLERAREDARAQGKRGLVALSTAKKRAFLSDPGFWEHRGFRQADAMEPDYVLYYLPLEADAPVPKLRRGSREVPKEGVAIYYSDHCPYTGKYVPLLEQVAAERGVPFQAVRFQRKEEAQQAPNPFTTYALFYDGRFVTNEIFSGKKFASFLDEKGK